jgi:hypothetical protein
MATHEVRNCGQGGNVGWCTTKVKDRITEVGTVEASLLGLSVGEWPVFLAIGGSLFKLRVFEQASWNDLERVKYISQDDHEDVLYVYND